LADENAIGGWGQGADEGADGGNFLTFFEPSYLGQQWLDFGMLFFHA
jgi:hypothetical protein